MSSLWELFTPWRSSTTYEGGDSKKGLEIYNIPEFKIHLFGVHNRDASTVRLAFGNGVQRDDLGEDQSPTVGADY